jgi:hypothetical protein
VVSYGIKAYTPEDGSTEQKHTGLRMDRYPIVIILILITLLYFDGCNHSFYSMECNYKKTNLNIDFISFVDN